MQSHKAKVPRVTRSRHRTPQGLRILSVSSPKQIIQRSTLMTMVCNLLCCELQAAFETDQTLEGIGPGRWLYEFTVGFRPRNARETPNAIHFSSASSAVSTRHLVDPYQHLPILCSSWVCSSIISSILLHFMFEGCVWYLFNSYFILFCLLAAALFVNTMHESQVD